MKNLFLIRGIPGSGKTTFAKTITNAICTADDYFININNEYVFDKKKLSDAHQWCKEKCERFMKRSISKIAVANTLVKESDLTSYYELADKYGYTVFSIIVENRHNGVSVHNVPEDTINKFITNFSIKLK